MANTIICRKYWCICCLRTALKNFNPQGGLPFEVDCKLADSTSMKCIQCNACYLLCEPAAPGMAGNALDLSAVIEWYTGFFDPQYTWDPSLFMDFSVALLGLVDAFENIEQSHRQLHGITGKKKERCSDEYNKFLEGHYTKMAHVQYLNTGATADDWAAYRSAKAL